MFRRKKKTDGSTSPPAKSPEKRPSSKESKRSSSRESKRPSSKESKRSKSASPEPIPPVPQQEEEAVVAEPTPRDKSLLFRRMTVANWENPEDEIFWLLRAELQSRQKQLSCKQFVEYERGLLVEFESLDYRNEVKHILSTFEDRCTSPDPDAQTVDEARPVVESEYKKAISHVFESLFESAKEELRTGLDKELEAEDQLVMREIATVVKRRENETTEFKYETVLERKGIQKLLSECVHNAEKRLTEYSSKGRQMIPLEKRVETDNNVHGKNFDELNRKVHTAERRIANCRQAMRDFLDAEIRFGEEQQHWLFSQHSKRCVEIVNRLFSDRLERHLKQWRDTMEHYEFGVDHSAIDDDAESYEHRVRTLLKSSAITLFPSRRHQLGTIQDVFEKYKSRANSWKANKMESVQLTIDEQKNEFREQHVIKRRKDLEGNIISVVIKDVDEALGAAHDERKRMEALWSKWTRKEFMRMDEKDWAVKRAVDACAKENGIIISRLKGQLADAEKEKEAAVQQAQEATAKMKEVHEQSYVNIGQIRRLEKHIKSLEQMRPQIAREYDVRVEAALKFRVELEKKIASQVHQIHGLEKEVRELKTTQHAALMKENDKLRLELLEARQKQQEAEHQLVYEQQKVERGREQLAALKKGKQDMYERVDTHLQDLAGELAGLKVEKQEWIDKEMKHRESDAKKDQIRMELEKKVQTMRIDNDRLIKKVENLEEQVHNFQIAGELPPLSLLLVQHVFPFIPEQTNDNVQERLLPLAERALGSTMLDVGELGAGALLWAAKFFTTALSSYMLNQDSRSLLTIVLEQMLSHSTSLLIRCSAVSSLFWNVAPREENDELRLKMVDAFRHQLNVVEIIGKALRSTRPSRSRKRIRGNIIEGRSEGDGDADTDDTAIVCLGTEDEGDVAWAASLHFVRCGYQILTVLLHEDFKEIHARMQRKKQRERQCATEEGRKQLEAELHAMDTQMNTIKELICRRMLQKRQEILLKKTVSAVVYSLLPLGDQELSATEIQVARAGFKLLSELLQCGGRQVEAFCQSGGLKLTHSILELNPHCVEVQQFALENLSHFEERVTSTDVSDSFMPSFDVREHAIRLVISALKNHRHVFSVVEVALRLFHKLSPFDDAAYSILRAPGGVSELLSVMECYEDDARVQAAVMAVFGNAFLYYHKIKLLAQANLLPDNWVPGWVFTSAADLQESRRHLEKGLERSLHADDEMVAPEPRGPPAFALPDLDGEVAHRAIGLILGSLRRHLSVASVVRCGTGALANLAMDSNYRHWLLNEGAVALLMKIMRHHSTSPPVLETAYNCLGNFALSNTCLRTIVDDRRGRELLEAMISVFTVYSEQYRLVSNVVDAMLNVCRVERYARKLASLDTSRIIRTYVEARHATDRTLKARIGRLTSLLDEAKANEEREETRLMKRPPEAQKREEEEAMPPTPEPVMPFTRENSPFDFGARLQLSDLDGV